MKITTIAIMMLIITASFNYAFSNYKPDCRQASYVEDDKSKAKELFKHRDNKEKLEECIKILEGIAEMDSETMVMLAKAYYFLAEFEDEKGAKMDIYDKGMKYGEMAMNAIEGFVGTEVKKKEEAAGIKKVTKENMDALYWAAANIARWAKFAPFVKKVIIKARVRYYWDRVFELDPNYNYGGAYRFFGGYYGLVPTITGENDPVKSKEMFDIGLEVAPSFLDTKVLYAEAYAAHAKVKDRELFNKLLDDVLNTDINQWPEIKPENWFAQQKAKKLKEQEAEIFE